LRLVLDTNVLVSALRSRRGASRQLLTGALTLRYSLLISVPLMLEYEAVLTRPEHLKVANASASDVGEILSALAIVSERVRMSYLWRPVLRDPADEMVLETAVNGGANLLCTFNVRDFPAARDFGIEVAVPAEAWKKVERSL
jgi:putative PIN family toxin of toxin-antitoxin system